MRVLMVTVPAEGHFVSALEIARELCRRGHQVVWYSGAAFQRRIEGTGAQFEPMKKAYDFGGLSRVEAYPHHADLGPIASITVGLREIFYDNAPDVLQDLRDIRPRFEPDVVVADDFSFGASFFCEQTGIPLVWVTNGMYLLGSRDTAPLGLALPPSATPLGRLRNAFLSTVTKRVVMRDLVRAADATRRRLGLPRLPGGPFENIARLPDLYLLCTVPAFEYPRTDMFPRAHFVGAMLGNAKTDAELPSWWHETEGGKPVVLVTQGTVAEDTERLLVPAIRALADEDALVVVTTGTSAAGELIPAKLPANVRVERFVPYSHLLPRLSVMVTNGGYNGVNSALANGVPLVVVPGSEEKAEIAARVRWAGAGVTVPRRRMSEAALRTAVREVLADPRYRQGAQHIREQHLRREPAADATDLIERLVTAGPSAVLAK